MIALDTNVLVRLLVRDDAAQLALAQACLLERSTPDDPAFVNHLVLIEFVWVLESVYAYAPDHVAQAIDGILATALLSVEDASSVRSAVASYPKWSRFCRRNDRDYERSSGRLSHDDLRYIGGAEDGRIRAHSVARLARVRSNAANYESDAVAAPILNTNNISTYAPSTDYARAAGR